MHGFVLKSGTELINPFKLLERVGIRHSWHVADMGCGSIGHFVLPAAQMVGPEGLVYALDIQRDVLDHVEKLTKREQIYNVRTVWADMDVFGSARIPDADLDLCLLVNNLFLSQNKPALLREIARLTKPGGRIVVIEWKAEATVIGPPPDRRLTMEECKSICQTPLMEFMDELQVGHSHYGLLYERTEVPIEQS